jgi:hypothetical protein
MRNWVTVVAAVCFALLSAVRPGIGEHGGANRAPVCHLITRSGSHLDFVLVGAVPCLHVTNRMQICANTHSH